jgi:hypothetical protein
MRILEVAMTSGRHEVPEIEFDDDDLLYEDDDDYVYNQRHGLWEPRPEWVHPECADTLRALEEGTCCKYPADALVSRALDLAEAVDRTLTGFDGGDGDCARIARELTRLVGSVPPLAAAIHAGIQAVNRTVAAQLLCPIGRLTLLVLELAGRSGCPMACGIHGTPDRRPGLALLVPVLEECDEALWSAVLPRVPPRR